MATRPVYCTEGAIRTHLGQNIKLPVGMTFDSLCESAANELDSKLSVRYITPIVVTPADPDQQATSYWLQSVSSMIAAARFMLSSAAPGSQETANNYGKYLLGTARSSIVEVTSGQRDLAGAIEANQTSQRYHGPTVLNEDAYSQVDLYYDNFEPLGFAPCRTPRPEDRSWPA